ncbi:MAG: hypothetical protein AB1611_08070 [bacterium]
MGNNERRTEHSEGRQQDCWLAVMGLLPEELGMPGRTWPGARHGGITAYPSTGYQETVGQERKKAKGEYCHAKRRWNWSDRNGANDWPCSRFLRGV